MGNMRFEIPATPAMDYFSSEDAPLLGDFIRRTIGDSKHYPHLHHGHSESRFDVADFPDTPLLPECSDDEFSDFVESPGSEGPPSLDGNADAEDASAPASEVKLADLPTLEYVQHVTIIVLVQLVIPIPFMLPMGLNFAKRAFKLLLPGFALAVLGHSLAYIAQKPTNTAMYDHLRYTLVDPTVSIPALYAHLKISIIGGLVVGAIMSHVLNLCILLHTVCRLSRGLEPQPTAMRRAMDASKAFQFLQRLVLDLVTGIAMLPAGTAMRDWFYGVQGMGVSGLPTDGWHAAATGILGVLAVQLYAATRMSMQHRVPLSKKGD